MITCEVPGCKEPASEVLYVQTLKSYLRLCMCAAHYEKRREL
jgi:hypothetical protein